MAGVAEQLLPPAAFCIRVKSCVLRVEATRSVFTALLAMLSSFSHRLHLMLKLRVPLSERTKVGAGRMTSTLHTVLLVAFDSYLILHLH